MLLPNRHGSTDSYRYGFQGQEKDDEIKGEGNSINYKYRMHDPRVGRFFAVDPLTSRYPHYSPYSFSGNKVIKFVELEGLEEALPERGKNDNRSEGDYSCGDVYHCGSDITDEGYYSETDYKKLFPTATLNSTYTKIRSDEAGTTVSYANILPLAVEKGKNPYVVGGLALTGLYITWAYNNSVNTKSWYDISMPEFTFPSIASTTDAVGPVAIAMPFEIPQDFTKSMEGYVTLYRGVASDNIWGDPNPAYPPSVFGLAVPQGGNANSVDANEGKPSNFTFWSINPITAYGFATKGQMGIGTVIAIRVPWGMAFPNASPDKYKEGEVQIPGSVTGVPIPVFK